MEKYNECLNPARSWSERIAFVEREARHMLSGLPDAKHVSTIQLIEMVYPAAQARGAAGLVARGSIGRLLRALATGALADCARRGDMKHVRGKDVLMWQWCRPITEDGLPVYNSEYTGSNDRARACPHCGGPI